MRKNILIFFLILNTYNTDSQTINNFEIYIDSLFKINGIITSNYPSLDTSNKETFFGYWISTCFKETKLNPVFDYVFKKELAKGMNVNVIFQLNNGVIYNIKSGSKNGDRIFNKVLKGYNFGEFIKAFQVNGICLYNLDPKYFNYLFEEWYDFPIMYGEGVSGCNC